MVTVILYYGHKIIQTSLLINMLSSCLITFLMRRYFGSVKVDLMPHGIGPSWLEKQKLEKNTWGFFGPRFENFWAGKMGEKFPGAILFHGLKNLSTNDVLKRRVDQWHFVWRFRHLLSIALKVTFGLLTITETPPLIKSLIKRNENEVVVNLRPCIKKLGIFSFVLYDPMTLWTIVC